MRIIIMYSVIYNCNVNQRVSSGLTMEIPGMHDDWILINALKITYTKI